MPKTGTTDLQKRICNTPSLQYREFMRSIPNHLTESGGRTRVHFLHRILVDSHIESSNNLLDFFCNWVEHTPTKILTCSELLSQTPRFSTQRASDVFRRISSVAEINFIIVLRPYFSWAES